MLKKFAKNWLTRTKKVSQFPDKDMVHAFTLKGRNFYKYKDINLMPVMRALSATDIYNELDMGISREYLTMHFKLVNELLNAGKFSELAQVNKVAQDRLEYITNYSLIFKLASIVYIEENENPKQYSLEIAEEKINFWQDNYKSIDAFFLNTQIIELVPYLSYSGLNTQNYGKAMTKEISLHLEHLFKVSSLGGENKEIKTLLNSLNHKNEAIKKLLV